MCSHERTCIDRRGVPSGPQHSGTTLLVLAITVEIHARVGGLLMEGGKQRWGERSEVQVRPTTGGERSGAHMLPLHGAHLLGKPGLLFFPQECQRVRSQSGSSSIFATTAYKLVPKLQMEKETRREMSSVAVWEYIISSCFPLIDGVRMHFNKTVRQIQGET